MKDKFIWVPVFTKLSGSLSQEEIEDIDTILVKLYDKVMDNGVL